MAQRVQILLEDDVDGSEASETIAFALDGKTYEIDLSAENSAHLRDDIGAWTKHARPVRGRAGAATRRASHATGDLGRIREWGRKNGFKVSDRGRVSAEIQEAYARAQR